MPFADPARQLFVHENRVVVFEAIGGAGRDPCTYGYDCVPQGDGSSTLLSVLDVSQPGAPHLLRSIELSGSLITARRIGSAVHAVVYDRERGVPGLKLQPGHEPSGPEEAIEAFERLRSANRALIEARPMDLVPGLREMVVRGNDAVPSASRAHDHPRGRGRRSRAVRHARVFQRTPALRRDLARRVPPARPREPRRGPDPQAPCARWWTQPGSQVKRSFISQQHLFSVSDTEIKIRFLAQPSKEWVTLSLVD